MAMTVKQAVKFASSPELLEAQTIEVVQEVVDTINASSDAKAKKRLDIVKAVLANMKKASGADTEKIEAVENSVKPKPRVVKPKVNKTAQAKAETKAPKIAPKAKAEPVAEPVAEEEVPAVELNELTVAELKGMAKGLGLPFNSKTTKKALVELIENNVTGTKDESEEEADENDEEALHLQLAELIDESSVSELKAIATDHSVKIPASMKKPSTIRQFLKDQIIGYDVQGNGDEEEEEPTAEASPFPSEHDGLIKIGVKQLQKAIIDTPYKVHCFIMEKGQKQPTAFLVTYANDEVVVLLDLTVQVNSVMSLEIKNHIVGDKAKIDDALCPMAFYAPKK